MHISDKRINVTILYPTGEEDSNLSLEEFLTELCLYLPARKFPPLNILSEYLKEGVRELGMSGGLEWNSFKLSQDHYDEYVQLKFINNEQNLKFNNEIEWSAWCQEKEYGIPAKEHQKHLLDIETNKKALETAKINNDQILVDKLNLEENELHQKWYDFLGRYSPKV